MTDNIASLEDFLTKRKATQTRLTPLPPKPLVGMVVYADGSWRITEQCRTAEEFKFLFQGLADAFESLRKLYHERAKP